MYGNYSDYDFGGGPYGYAGFWNTRPGPDRSGVLTQTRDFIWRTAGVLTPPPFDVLTPLGTLALVGGAAVTAALATDSADHRVGLRNAAGEVYTLPIVGFPIGDTRALIWLGSIAYGRMTMSEGVHGSVNPELGTPLENLVALAGGAAFASLVVSEAIRAKERGVFAEWRARLEGVPVLGSIVGLIERLTGTVAAQAQAGASAIEGAAAGVGAGGSAGPELMAVPPAA